MTKRKAEQILWTGKMWTDGRMVYSQTGDQSKPFQRTLEEFFSMRDRVLSNVRRGKNSYSKTFVDAVMRISVILDGDFTV